jgi:hypothetical protein
MYLSASGKFIFVVTDVRGETYPLEVKIGRDGIPIDRFIVLICEVGVETNSSAMRVLVNGIEVQQRRLPFSIDLGDRKWGSGSVVGADSSGQNHATLSVAEMGILDRTFRPRDLIKFMKYARNKYSDPFD